MFLFSLVCEAAAALPLRTGASLCIRARPSVAHYIIQRDAGEVPKPSNLQIGKAQLSSSCFMLPLTKSAVCIMKPSKDANTLQPQHTKRASSQRLATKSEASPTDLEEEVLPLLLLVL